MDTQTQIDRLIELAIVQRAELKKLVSELPQLREHLNAEIERVFESTEPQLRTELEDWTTKQAHDQTVKLGDELEAKIVALSKSLEATTQTRYNAIMAERAENIDLAKKAEDKLAEVAQAIPVQVKQIVTDELARFPRAGEIDQLRKEFAEPRGLNPRGRWEPGATYYKLDLVAYNGDSYVANEETSEKPSRTSSKWTLNAARGQAGGGGFMSPAGGDYTASMITNVPAGTIAATNVQDAINELDAKDVLSLSDGTAAAPSLNFTSDTNTGLYRPAADTVGIVSGGHEILRITDVANATDYLEIKGAIGVATPVHVIASGPSASIGMHLQPKGSGLLTISDGTDVNKGIRFRSSSSAASAITLLDAVSTAGRVITLPDATDTLVGKATTDTLTNKTLTTPTIDSITASASTALTLTGGSTGASLVLGSGATAADVTITPKGTGIAVISGPLVVGASSSAVQAAWTGTGYAGHIAFPDTSNFSVFSEPNTLYRGGGMLTNIARIGGSWGFVDSTKPAWRVYFGNGALSDNFSIFRSASTTYSESSLLQLTGTGNLLIGTTTDAASLAGGLVVNGSGAGAAASSTVTGALRVTGGVGVSGAVYGDELRVKKGGGTSSYINGLTLESGAGAGNFWPGVEWRDAALGSMARQYSYREGGSYATSMVFQTSIAGSATPTTALTLSSAQAATFGGIVVYKNYTVATLPSAIVYAYGEAYVSDATQAAGTSLGSAPTGGGSVKRGVYSDGSSWLLR